MHVQPYLFLDGRCEEALEFYRSTLGAEITMLMRFKESPEPPQPGMVPPGSDNKVMHSSFRIGDTTLMASDGRCLGKPTFQGFSLSLTVPNDAEAERLFARVTSGNFSQGDAELFRAAMLVEMARMSLEDGLVMQLHPGSFRNHNRWLFTHFGRDKGADIPQRTEYVHALRPLLDRFGNERALTLILFTLDETSYSRELAPLAGHYPILKLGPAWWFHDSPEGMRRFREQTTETAGFYNTVGFNDDTRAFLSIPARHDLARRVDCSFLARLVVEHRLEADEAVEVAVDLAYRLPKQAYKL